MNLNFLPKLFLFVEPPSAGAPPTGILSATDAIAAGARPDGVADFTEAIQRAIDDLPKGVERRSRSRWSRFSVIRWPGLSGLDSR